MCYLDVRAWPNDDTHRTLSLNVSLLLCACAEYQHKCSRSTHRAHRMRSYGACDTLHRHTKHDGTRMFYAMYVIRALACVARYRATRNVCIHPSWWQAERASDANRRSAAHTNHFIF